VGIHGRGGVFVGWSLEEVGVIRTMLPLSVVPRAKMKMTRGQLEELPSSRSVRVDRSWRASIPATSSTRVVGRAAARVAAARRLRNFMFAADWARGAVAGLRWLG
jgi:hypothetical protein